MSHIIGSAWPISNALVERCGWMLLHSLWQLSLVAAVAAIAMHQLRRNSAVVRYTVLLVSMAVAVSVPAVTWNLLPTAPAASVANEETEASSNVTTAVNQITTASAARLRSGVDALPATPTSPVNIAEIAGTPSLATSNSVRGPATVSTLMAWSEWTTAYLRPWLPLIVMVWVAGVLFCSLRPLLGWHTMRRLQQVGVSPVSEDILVLLRRAGERLGSRCVVRVLQSTFATVPVVVGYVRPVILLPVSLVTTIPSDQLEAILAHELAHVMRHDFILNLLQTLVETLFFYHPAVWWLSRRIRIEREHCCDDRVIATLGNRLAYGRALLAVEELRGQSALLALGANDGSMLSRLRRILGNDTVAAQSTAARHSNRWPVALCCALALCTTLALSGQPDVAAKDPAVTPADQLHKPFVAELPDGITVELLGLAEMSTKPMTWWKPDGSALEQIPQYASTSLKPAVPEERRAVVRVRGVKDKRDVIANYTGVRMDFARSSDGNMTHADVRAFPVRGQKTGRIEIGVATEPLSATRYVEVQKQAPQRPAATVDPVVEDIKVIAVNGTQSTNPQTAQEAADGISINFASPAPANRQFDLELKCVDIDGQAHDSTQISTNGPDAKSPEMTYSFAVPVKRAAWFEYRLRIFRHWVQFDNISLDPGQTTEVKVTTESVASNDADGLAGQFATSITQMNLPFLNAARIQELRNQLQTTLAPHLRQPLSRARREQLMAGLVAVIKREFNPDEGDTVYLEFANRFATLQWGLKQAVARGELTAEQSARLERQRTWMRAEIEKLPELLKFRHTHQTEFDKVQSLFDDPLNPFFQTPMSDAEFVAFQTALARNMAHIGQYQKLLYVSYYLLQSAYEALRPRLLPTNPGWSRSNLRYSIMVEPKVGLTSMHLSDVNANPKETHADVVRSLLFANAPPADAAARATWREEQAEGDVAFDGQFDALIAVRRAKLGVLKVGNWFAADQVPLRELRKIVEAEHATTVPLSTFVERAGDSGNGSRRVRTAAPFLIVQTGADHIAVVQITNIAGDGPIIVSRPRPADNAAVKPEAQARQQVELLANQLVASLKTLNLPFLNETLLRAVHRELIDDVASHLAKPVSDNRLKQISQAVSFYCLDMPFIRLRHETQFMTHFETLKWHLITALDHDELTPGELARRESQRQWLRQYVSGLPDSSGGKIGQWMLRDGTTADMTTLEFKLLELENLMTDPLNPYYAWPLSDSEFEELKQDVKNQKWLTNPSTDITGAPNAAGHAMTLQTEGRVRKRWPIEHPAGAWDPWGKMVWRYDEARAGRKLAALQQEQQTLEANAQVESPASVMSSRPDFKLSDRLNVMAVGFRRDGQELVSVATDSAVTARQWDLTQKLARHEAQLESELHGNRFLMGRLTLSADCQRVAAILEGDVCVWETSTGKLLKKLERAFEPSEAYARNLACTPDMSFIACGYEASQVKFHRQIVVWDAFTGKVMQTLHHDEKNSGLHSIALSADGKRLATSGEKTCLWEVATGNLIREIPNTNPGLKHPGMKYPLDRDSERILNRVMCLTFSPDGQQLATGDMLGVKLIDATSGEIQHRMEMPFTLGLSGLVFSKDGQMLARVATDRIVPIWSTKSGQLIRKLLVESNAGAFSEDGQWFAVGATDEKQGISMWKVR